MKQKGQKEDRWYKYCSEGFADRPTSGAHGLGGGGGGGGLFSDWGLGSGVWASGIGVGWGFGVWGLRFEVWGLGWGVGQDSTEVVRGVRERDDLFCVMFKVWGLELRVRGLGSRV